MQKQTIALAGVLGAVVIASAFLNMACVNAPAESFVTVSAVQTAKPQEAESSAADNKEDITGWRISDGMKLYFKDGERFSGYTEIDGYEYYLIDGIPLTGFQEVGDKYYLFDDEGKKLYGGWYEDHYADDDGFAAVLRWVETKNEDGVTALRYFKKDGHMAKAEWITTPDGTYYILDNGEKASGWCDIGGTSYYFDENGILDKDKKAEDKNGNSLIGVKTEEQHNESGNTEKNEAESVSEESGFPSSLTRTPIAEETAAAEEIEVCAPIEEEPPAVITYESDTAYYSAMGYFSGTQGDMGRLVIPSVGFSVPLYYADYNNQAVVDAPDSAAYMPESYVGGCAAIADHNNQGFGAIKNCNTGSRMYIVKGNSVDIYECFYYNPYCRVESTSTNEYDAATGEILNYLGGTSTFTCNDDGETVTLLHWNYIGTEAI